MAGPTSSASSEGPGPSGGALYPPGAIVDVQLRVTKAVWDQLLTYYEQRRKVVVPADLVFDGEVIEDVGLRLKGTVDRWTPGRKMQFLVRFDYYSNGRLHGRRRLNLDHEGVAPIRNNLGMTLFTLAGHRAPRTAWVRLAIDTLDAVEGEGYPTGYYGLYESIEVVDDVFLDERFAKSGGSLYKGAEVQEEGDPAHRQCDLDTLLTLVDSEPLEGDHTACFERLEAIADVEQLVDFYAVEAAVALGDNLWAGGNNFYLYNDPTRGFVAIPWDVDDVLSEVSPPQADLFDFSGVVRVGALPNRLWQLIQRHPTWRQAFVTEVERIRAELFGPLAGHIDAWCALVKEEVRLDTTRRFTMAEFDHDCALMRLRLKQRDAYLTTVASGRVAP